MTMPAWNQRPKNPSIWDDEFESDRMHPKWVPIHAITVAPNEEFTLDPTTGSSTQNWENSHRHKTSWWCRQGRSAGTDNVQGYQQDISAIPDECILFFRGGRGFRRAFAGDQDSEIMIRISNDALNDYVLIMWDSFGSIFSPLFARNSPSQGLGYLNLGLVRNYFGFGEPAEYLAVTKRGMRWDGWCGSSGGNWVHLGGHDQIIPMTKVNITFNNDTTATPGTGLAGLDFFRVLPGLNLP